MFVLINTAREEPLNKPQLRLISFADITTAVQDYLSNDLEESDAQFDSDRIPAVKVYLKYNMQHINMLQPGYEFSNRKLPQYPEDRPSEVWILGTLQQFYSSLKAAQANSTSLTVLSGGERLLRKRMVCTGIEGKTITMPELIGAEVLFITVGEFVIWDVTTPSDSEVYFNSATGETVRGGDDGEGGPIWQSGDKVAWFYYPAEHENEMVVELDADGSISIPAGRVVDTIYVIPADTTPAFSIGLTNGGKELVGDTEIASFPTGGTFGLNYPTMGGVSLWFNGIVSQTTIKIKLIF